jgi:hypothetical protein
MAAEEAVTVAVVEAVEARMVVEVEVVLAAVVEARTEAALTGTKSSRRPSLAGSSYGPPQIGAGLFCVSVWKSASQLFASRGVYYE